ncbi:MAG: hypothetical protein RL077_3662 [Verrucomicrobiota bacterium]|jgi:hypothetical protein
MLPVLTFHSPWAGADGSGHHPHWHDSGLLLGFTKSVVIRTRRAGAQPLAFVKAARVVPESLPWQGSLVVRVGGAAVAAEVRCRAFPVGEHARVRA